MLNNPCNPTGAAYSADDLRLICDVLLRHPDVWIFTDDIYDKLAGDGPSRRPSCRWNRG